MHCDYTENSAPLRVRQLLEKESYTGFFGGEKKRGGDRGGGGGI